MISENPSVLPLKGDPDRDATDSIRGYVYQVYQSTLAWIELKEGDTLFLECAEDFEVHSEGRAEPTQVKDTKTNHTLRTPDVRDAIQNFWKYTEENPGIEISFRYLATAKIGMELGGLEGSDISGLQLWREASFGRQDSSPLRKFLLEMGVKSSSLRDLLESASEEELSEKLLKRIKWDLEQKSIAPLIDDLKKAIVLPASTQGINAVDAKSLVLNFVILQVVKLLTVKGVKQLTRRQLYEDISKAGLVTITRTELNALSSRAETTQEDKKRVNQCPIIWIHGTTEDDTYVPRKKYLKKLDKILSDEAIRSVTAHGIAGHGKTSLVGYWLKEGNGVKTGRFKQAFFWSFYSNRSVDQLIEKLIEVLDPGVELNQRATDKKGRKSSKMDELTPIEKFERNARRFPPSLVVLDGVEVLQHRLSEGVDYGRFVDSRLQTLLQEIARLSSPWLVLCTSRFPLTDRHKYDNDRHIELGPLETDEAIELLRHNNVRGPITENKRVANALQGHPLALKLFAASLPSSLKNEPKRHLISVLGTLGTDASFEDKIVRLVEFYSQSIEKLQQLLLFTLSIFRIPISLDTIRSVTIALAPEHDFDVTAVSHVAAHLEKLTTSGIVVCDDNSTGRPTYSCHPVILDSFRRELLNQPAGNAAINLLTDRPDDIALDGVSQLEPLIIAFQALIELGDTWVAMQIYNERFENGRIFVRLGLPYDAARVFDALLYDATHKPAKNGTTKKVRQNAVERKFLVPAADFDISVGELGSAQRRLERALMLLDRYGRPDAHRNYSRLIYLKGDLVGAAEHTLKATGNVEQTAIALYYRLRALACSGEIDEAKSVLSQICEMRYKFEIPDLKILEPMGKIFLALRNPNTTVDTSAIGDLTKSADFVLEPSRRLEAKLLACHAKIVLQQIDMGELLAIVKREAVAGQYRIREYQANILIAYSNWGTNKKVDIGGIKYINSVAADENYSLIQCECLRILSLCEDQEDLRAQYQNQFKLNARSIGYTSASHAFPNK